VDTGRYAKLFLSESRENLSEINGALLDLERGGGSSDASIGRLFRAVHTMKGMGGAMGYASVSDLSHELETLLDRLRTGALTVTPAIMDTLFAGADALEQSVDLATGLEPKHLDIAEIVTRVKAAATSTQDPSAVSDAPASPLEKKLDESQRPAAKSGRNIRIDARKLDTLMNVMGELVVARDRVVQIAEQLGDEALLEATLRASQIIATLQNEIMTSRMVPVWQVFDRFPRVVRDTARTLGKDVEFKIEGKEIELDRSMLDEMGEPVLHLLRNSLDHGIELPSEREKNGKPRVATLTLTAERDRATVLIRVTDDGRGIDQSKVLPRAKRLGLVDEATTSLSEEELVRIIARPGFSTAESVTDISGRGVGFDVVASKVRALGGSLEVHTDSGLGTNVSMRLPLTLAITRALIARVDTEMYAIPLTHVLETFALSGPMLQEVKGREVVAIRDDVFTAIWLRERVGLSAPNKTTGQVVLVELADKRAALIVDEFLGQQEIVVKQFDGVAGSRTLFSGATILGDGAAALIVDASTLL
jgi:two-component system, chemotaxis family, sensor kinase CheA